MRPVAGPGEHQRVLLFNGHKRVLPLNFSVIDPNGLIVNLFGAVDGRRHDIGMLAITLFNANSPTSMVTLHIQ